MATSSKRDPNKSSQIDNRCPTRGLSDRTPSVFQDLALPGDVSLQHFRFPLNVLPEQGNNLSRGSFNPVAKQLLPHPIQTRFRFSMGYNLKCGRGDSDHFGG